MALIAVFAAALVPTPAVADAEPAAPVVVAFGDSLIHGYGLATADTFPVRLQAALAKGGIAAEVVNAGVSGDTTAGGLARADWVLGDDPDLVILALGANDGLRGIDPAATRENLDRLIGRLTAAGTRVLLAGMLAPPNLGPDYAAGFNPIYRELAEKHDVPLYPFILEGVATDPTLNQADGIHPNADGVQVMVERILPQVRALLDDPTG